MNKAQSQHPRKPDETLLLPYQARFIADTSRIRVWEKSRRIGGTETIAFEAVYRRGLKKTTNDLWFSSKDESAAIEFMDSVRNWCRLFNYAAEFTDASELIDEREIRVLKAEFPSGAKIVAMTSNPSGMRSKGGDVVLDEFSRHADAKQMWQSASPVVMWGGTITVISTHNGETSYFNELVQMGKRRRAGQTRPGDILVSLHTTTLDDAIAEGLAERVALKSGRTDLTREQFRAETLGLLPPAMWDEEYFCKPSSESSSYFPFDLLRLLPRSEVQATDQADAFFRGLRTRLAKLRASNLYVGVDVGRRRDRFVVVVRARVGGQLILLAMLRYHKRGYDEMEAVLDRLMDESFEDESKQFHRVRRLCIDETGIGNQLAERLHQRFRTRIEPVHFSAPVKEDLATRARRDVEQRAIDLPDEPAILGAWNSIRLELVNGKPRYSGEHGPDGHQDEFWADALCLCAGDRGKHVSPYAVATTDGRSLQ